MKFKQLSPLKKCLVLLVPIAYITIALVLYFTCGKELIALLKDKAAFKAWLSGFGVFDEIIFVSIRAFQTVIKIIPAEPLEIAAGYVWGTYKGFALCLLGTEIGSFIILFLTSVFGVKLVNLFYDSEKINQWSFINDSQKKYTLLTIIYLIPGTPKDFLTYLIGITDTNIFVFLLVTGIARVPSIISSTWCGSVLESNGIKMFALVFSVITALSAIIAYFAKKRFDKRSDA